jgi:long-subunit fatty acid transport protein
MKRVNKRRRLSLAVAASLAVSGPALAITNIEANAGPQFNFISPGARSLGMAGAFTGLADDSTAAFTNPAGLGQLSRKEMDFEGRYTDFSTVNVVRGRLEGAPTGIGVDTISGLQTQSTSTSVVNPSFLSAAFPLSHGTLAIYRHELANFEANFASEGPVIQTFGPGVPAPGNGRVNPTKNDIDLKIVDYGFAGSWRIGKTWMVGGSINYYRFDFQTLTRRYDFDANQDGIVTPLERLTVTDLSDAALFGLAAQHGSDGAFSYNVGALWLPNDRWSVGLVFRNGPSFDYAFDTHRIGVSTPLSTGTTDFTVPDVFSLGIGYRPSDAWRISFDASRVFYSDHSEGVISQNDAQPIDYLTINDATELRAGAEYTAINAKRPYSIRFGAWHEPDHQMYFNGTVVPFTGTPLTPEQLQSNTRAALFVRGKNAMHYSFGYGMVFKKLQLDAAIDLSTRADVLSISLAYFLN